MNNGTEPSGTEEIELPALVEFELKVDAGVDLLQSLEETQIIAECLAGISSVYLHIGAVEQAVRLLSAANTLMDSVPIQLDMADQIEYDHTLSAARSQLSPTAWAEAWTAGASTALDLIIADALQKPTA